MTRLLASVRSLDEALLVLAAGADIIDLKQPADGALGALAPPEVRRIVAAIAGRRPVSATIGDLPLRPGPVAAAVAAMAATGVDYVKIGFFGGGQPEATLAGLAGLAGRTPLVAVLFADQAPELALLPALAAARFAGVMLDTADKSAGPLPALMAAADLAGFVGLAKRCGLLCGLAGSLRLEDVPGLLALAPDYLGFRGALCQQGRRSLALHPPAVARLRQAVAGGC